MSDTVNEGTAPRVNADNCVVLDRDEALAELARAIKATDRIALRQGIVGGQILASLVACVWWALGVKLDPPGVAFGFALAACAGALLWRIWDAGDTTVVLMGWDMKGFAGTVLAQTLEEVHGGRADG